MLVPMFTWSDGSKLQSPQPRDGRSATIVIAYLMWRCATRCIMMNHLNRPKRNCSTHVFNVAACLRLLKRRFSLSFEAAHERIRQKRPICNPNTGGCSRVSPWVVQLFWKSATSVGFWGLLLVVTWYTVHALAGCHNCNDCGSQRKQLCSSELTSQSVWMESSEMAGFTCQLLQLAKKLSSSQAGHLSFARHVSIFQPSKFFSPVPWVHPS